MCVIYALIILKTQKHQQQLVTFGDVCHMRLAERIIEHVMTKPIMTVLFLYNKFFGTNFLRINSIHDDGAISS